MNVVIRPKTAKHIEKLDSNIKSRILKALEKLSKEPPDGDIVALKGQNGFRLRVGKYRILFEIIDNAIIVYDIDLRGQVYKGR